MFENDAMSDTVVCLIGIASPTTQCLYMYIEYMSSFGRSSYPDSEAMHVKLLLWETSSCKEYEQ